MNRIRGILRKHLFQGIFIGILALLLLRTTGANAALALSCGQWSVVPSQSTGMYPALEAVTAISAKNAWAVGYIYNSNSSTYQTIIEHWPGKRWSIVKSPSAGLLFGVAAVSAKDIWAVGEPSISSNSALIEHWDGTSWSVVSSPNGSTSLYAVAAISANDVWAVGNSILHWDGTTWSIALNAPPAGLNGITAISADDIWAVGGYDKTLTMHWDGKQWSVIPSPTPPLADCAALQGVTAISTNDVWAVGWYTDSCNVPPLIGFVEHWDGTQWSIVSIPSPGKHTNQLLGVAARSTNDVWAVGYYTINPKKGTTTLTYHWDGSTWSEVPDPNVNNSAFNGVAVTPKGDFWAVGSSEPGPGAPFVTLTEFYC